MNLMNFWKLICYNTIVAFAGFLVILMIDPSGNNLWALVPSLAVSGLTGLFLFWRDCNQSRATPQPTRVEKTLFAGMLGVVVGLVTFQLIGLSTSLIITSIVMMLARAYFPWHKINYLRISG